MTTDIQNVMQVINDFTNILRVELGEEFSATDVVPHGLHGVHGVQDQESLLAPARQGEAPGSQEGC